MCKNVDSYMYELIDHMDALKGLETLLDAFQLRYIDNPLDAPEDKDEYIQILSRPYPMIIESLRNTIALIDNMTDDMSMPVKEGR